MLRAGDQADALKDVVVAVVGCGAVGSHAADLLARGGVRRLRLIDGQTLRPGNCIRHLAGPEYVGDYKANATVAVLSRSGVNTSQIRAFDGGIRTLGSAAELFADVDLVLDATGDNRALAVLDEAAADCGKPLLSVALMRQGGITVVDRIGPKDDQTAHTAPLETPPKLEGAAEDLRERGCGDAVSQTPPHSVVAAASLATRLVIDELIGRPVPSSTFEVLEPQPDEPYTRRGVITS